MSRQLKDLVEPMTAARGVRAGLAPAVPGSVIQPGLESLSPEEARELAVRICDDYLAANRAGGVPSADSIMQNLSWYVVALAYGAEADVREAAGETREAQLLRDVVDLVIEREDDQIDAVDAAAHLLSTGYVFQTVGDDLCRTLFGQRLVLSYLDADEIVRYHALPKGGFSCTMT